MMFLGIKVQIHMLMFSIDKRSNRKYMYLNNILINSANAAIRLQLKNGSMPSGHNGPYYDKETPVRNTAHWIITFSKAHELSGKKLLLVGVNKAANYLLTKAARPKYHSFHLRTKKGKDKCNGLIGQAWTFEALAEASKIFEDPKYVELAEEVFFQHYFNYKYGLWNRLEIDGKNLSIDSAFNHQLWFAACVSLLKTPREKQIKKIVVRFLDCLQENMTILDNGLIYHPIERKVYDKCSRTSLKGWIKKTAVGVLNSWVSKKYKQKLSDDEKRKRMIHKSIGYHQFNMYAFAMLKEQIPDHSFWKTLEFKKMVTYMLTDEYKKGLEDNKYGYPYNPPGFEVPYALSVSGNFTEEELMTISEYWLNEQLKRCYNPETGLMDRNTEDPITHTARVYESTRLPRDVLEKIKIQVH